RQRAAAEAPIRERSLERIPRLDAPKGQPSGVEAPAARTRKHPADRDAVLPKRLTDEPGLLAAALIEIALRGAVVESGVGRIEPTGREAVAQHHDTAICLQDVPDRVSGVRDRRDERERQQRDDALNEPHRCCIVFRVRNTGSTFDTPMALAYA